METCYTGLHLFKTLKPMFDFLELLGYEGLESIDSPEEIISNDTYLMETESVEGIEVDDLYLPDIVQQNIETNKLLKTRSK